MITCTKHERVYTGVGCDLQARVREKLLAAQADGDAAAVLYLVDRDDSTHVALATIGVGQKGHELAAMWLLGALSSPAQPAPKEEDAFVSLPRDRGVPASGDLVHFVDIYGKPQSGSVTRVIPRLDGGANVIVSVAT